MLTPLILIYGIVVLALFLLFASLSMFLGDRAPKKTASLRRKRISDGVSPWLAEILVTRPVRGFEVLCISSGIRYSPMQILSGMLVGTMIAMFAMNFLRFGAISSLAVSLLIGVGAPILIIRRMRRRRMAALTRQLPDALDMMVRSLRVGHPVAVGISMIGTEMLDPIGGEFRRVYQSMSFGLDLKDALEDLSTRLEVPDVRYMVAAIRIQYATGGNLSEVLASLSNVMRERVRLAMKVKALSSETRFSGHVMSVLPFLLVGGLFLLRPDFYKEVPNSRVLQEIMGGAGILLAVGVFLMRRIVNIRA